MDRLARSRAIDSQAFVAMASPARDTKANYVAWGHSSIVDPWLVEAYQSTSRSHSFMIELLYKQGIITYYTFSNVCNCLFLIVY